MAIYTQNQLDRLADKVRAGDALSKAEALNLIQDCAKLRVDLIDARESMEELEQWRKALVWYRDSADGTLSLCVTNTGVVLAYVLQTSDGWVVGVVGGGAYQSRTDALRAAEAALGLPKCRVEGEP